MLLDVIKKRKSVRTYDNKPINDKIIYSVIEAARLAPSAKNIQEWKFIIIRDKNTKKALVDIAKGQQFIKNAAVIIAGVATKTDYTMTNTIPACHVDLAIAMEHIALAAAEMGIGTCWIGAFYQEKAKKLLKVPHDFLIVAFMTLGYASDGITADKINRKKIEDIICWESYC